MNKFCNDLKRNNMSKDKKDNQEKVLDESVEQENLEQQEEITTSEDDQQALIEKLEEENKKLKEDFLRAFADAENVKKRCQQEIEKNNKYAIGSFAKNLLGVADNLQRAIDAAAKEENNEACASLLKGVELTQNELVKAFDKFGVSKMEIMGTVFDPNYHQVVQEVEDKTKPVGTIIAEVQTGYMINDRILREAMVVVSKK